MIKKFFLLCAMALAMTACGGDEPEPGPNPNPNPDPGTETALKPEDVTMPRKEIRAVWLCTVRDIDWPRNKTNPEVQKQEFIEYLDLFKQHNINTVIMQVRPCADAFYNSSLEPWSQYLTGTQGQNPGWDVMDFMIEETHKRGMEFHAWMNPYRICEDYTKFNPAANAISNQHPEWVMQYGKLWILNPGLPEVRQHLCNVVADLLDKYDVDGIHFDDYFYPYPDGSTLPDMEDYKKYGVPAGFTSIANWRRDNVNKAIEMVHNTILAHKPGAVFSVSPFCVWRNASQDPRGSQTNTISNYDNLYADILKWCEENWIDLVVPQLYYTTQNQNANFLKLVQWWPDNVGTCPLAIGLELDLYSPNHSQAIYQTTTEIEQEFFYARRQQKVQGFFLFCAKVFKENKINLLGKIAQMFPEPSVIPFFGRTTVAAPTALSQLKADGKKLSWENKGNGMRYVVYRIEAKEAHTLDIVNTTSYEVTGTGYYAVSVLNADNTESTIAIVNVK